MNELEGREEQDKRYRYLEMHAAIREEVDKCRLDMENKFAKMQEAQSDIQRDVEKWNRTATVIQWVAVATASTIAALAAAFEWLRDHIK